MNFDDTIVAIATPPGRGGVGVVRLSGPEARQIVAPMLRLKHQLEPGRVVFGELVEPCGAGTLAREPSARMKRVSFYFLGCETLSAEDAISSCFAAV